jgi:hypothetical protein
VDGGVYATLEVLVGTMLREAQDQIQTAGGISLLLYGDENLTELLNGQEQLWGNMTIYAQLATGGSALDDVLNFITGNWLYFASGLGGAVLLLIVIKRLRRSA